MIDTPHITSATAQRTACIRLTIPREQIRHVMGPGIQEIFAALAAQGIAPSGAWRSHHLRMDPNVFDFEICVPVTARIRPAGRVQEGEIPAAAKLARTVHHGGYEGLGDAWAEFHAWVAKAGHKPAANLWEVYSVGPESGPDPSKWRTELNKPLVA